jgi:hypothetical protein
MQYFLQVQIDTWATTACELAEKSFQRVWDNPEDAEYDNL